jgi:TrwC relaxase
VVLRIHIVRDGGYAYYVDGLVPGRAEGSLVAGEEPGRWWGAATSAVGLRGRVDGQPFGEVLAGRDPVSAAPLRTGRAGREG